MRDTTTKVRKTLELIKEDEDWAQERFPGISSFWLHQKLMEAFRASIEENDVTLTHYINLGAKEVKALFELSSEGENINE